MRSGSRSLTSISNHLIIYVGAGQGFIGWWMVKSGLEWLLFDQSFCCYARAPCRISYLGLWGSRSGKTCYSCVSFIVGITMDFNMNVNACVLTASQYSSMVRAFILMFELPSPHFIVRVFHMKNTLKFQF